jgi:hypothetical protein
MAAHMEMGDSILSDFRHAIPETAEKDVLAPHESNAYVEHMLSALNRNPTLKSFSASPTPGSSKLPSPGPRSLMSIASSSKPSRWDAVSRSGVHSSKALPTDLTSKAVASVQQGFPHPASPTLYRASAPDCVGGPDTASSTENPSFLPLSSSHDTFSPVKPAQHGSILPSVAATFEPANTSSTLSDSKTNLTQESLIHITPIPHVPTTADKSVQPEAIPKNESISFFPPHPPLSLSSVISRANNSNSIGNTRISPISPVYAQQSDISLNQLWKPVFSENKPTLCEFSLSTCTKI